MCEKALKNKKMMKKLGVKMSSLKKNSTFKKNFMKGCVSKLKKILGNLAWILVFVLPWIWRRLRGKSSGDGRSAKYIEPTRWSAR